MMILDILWEIKLLIRIEPYACVQKQYGRTINMKSDNAGGRTSIKVDNKRAEVLRKKFQSFKQQFDQEQSKFASSSESDYYIVSTTYLAQWTEFCSSSQPERLEPKPMNQDLMDAGGQFRKGLVEKKDFQIVNQTIYDLIKIDRGFELKRSAVFVGKEKRVPVYLDLVKYVRLSSKDVHDIDYKKLQLTDFKMKLVEISLQDTVERLTKKIRQNENISSRQKIRVWKNSTQDVSVERLYKYVKEKTENMYSQYRFDGLGKLIEEQNISIEDLSLDQNDYFIAEIADEYSSWFLKAPGEAKCEGCYKYKKLPYPCGCKAVAYCTLECQEKDKRYHIKDCKFAEEQELNEEIQMKITSSSSLGRVGLTNLGNTCFMNSCLQCLSNTTLLTDYFLKKYFDKEINKQNPLGSKGRLARNYAKFIKNMWCSSESTYSPHNLKSAVAKLNPIFSGYAQHDSQEFFSFLVDGLHQDLNRVLKKPYVESVESKNRKDQIVAMESWIAYTQRNQSIIVDLLTGQYKSKVICPVCKIESITFDPFTTVSLPIPEEPEVSQMKFYVIFSDNQRQALKMSFQYTKANAKEWLATATKMLKRNEEDFVFYVLTVMENIYPFESTSKAEIIQKIEDQNKNVFLLELSEQEKKINQRVELVTRLCKKSYHFNEYDNLWFKRPFFFEKSTTKVQHIYSKILKYLEPVYHNKKQFKSYLDYESKMLNEKPFALVLKYKKSIERYYGRIQTKFEKQLVLDNLEQKLSTILQDLSPNDYELDVRFSKDTTKLFEFERLKKCSDGQQKTLKSSQKHQSSSISLDECFRVFEEQEQLEPGNQWYCPQCKQHRLATKQMTIYKAPQILILHLKRFKNKGTFRKEKNETNVQFPSILNMKKYLIDPKPMSSYISLLKKQDKYCEPSFETELRNSEPEYELYAISNHYGGLGGGHYTAYAKNRDKWFQFNDSSVSSATESDLRGSGAYMLFYRRINSMLIK